MKKTVHLKITTTFVTYKDYEVDENLTDEEILEQANNDGDFLEDVLDTLDIDTNVEFAEEGEGVYHSPFTYSREELPNEDEISRPDIDNYSEMEQYVREYLKTEYGYEAKSFKLEYDMRSVYITNIEWKEEK